MKTRPYTGQLSRFGGFAAMLMSLMPCADSSAQDGPATSPPAACAAAAPVPVLVACSPDGEFYATAAPDGRIKCSGTHEGARTRTLLLCNPRALLFSPDGRFLAAAGTACAGSAVIKVWRVADGTLLSKVPTGSGEDPHMCFSPDGLLLASTGENSRIKLWQLPEGTPYWSAPAGRPVSSLAIAKGGKAVIAVFSDGSIQRFPVP